MSPIYVPGKVVLAKEFTPQSYMYEFPSQYPVWTPADITTALWLDAADASTVQATAGLVDAWNDKSGNSRNVSAVSTARPANTATQNGRKVLTFDGINDSLTRPGGVITGSSARTVCAVAKPVNGNTFFDFGTEAAAQRYSVSLNSAFIGANSANIAWSTIASSSYGIYVFPQSGSNLSSVTAFWNGTSYASTSSVSPTLTLNTGTTSTAVGCDVSSSSFFSGDIAEIIVMQQAVDTTTRQKLEGYLAWKWGLTANLPAGHPYKTVGPTP